MKTEIVLIFKLWNTGKCNWKILMELFISNGIRNVNADCQIGFRNQQMQKRLFTQSQRVLFALLRSFYNNLCVLLEEVSWIWEKPSSFLFIPHYTEVFIKPFSTFLATPMEIKLFWTSHYGACLTSNKRISCHLDSPSNW